jgi:hypothetical protein
MVILKINGTHRRTPLQVKWNELQLMRAEYDIAKTMCLAVLFMARSHHVIYLWFRSYLYEAV